MTDQEKCAKLAELMEWRNIQFGYCPTVIGELRELSTKITGQVDDSGKCLYGISPTGEDCAIPDYLNDRNAWPEVRRALVEKGLFPEYAHKVASEWRGGQTAVSFLRAFLDARLSVHLDAALEVLKDPVVEEGGSVDATT